MPAIGVPFGPGPLHDAPSQRQHTLGGRLLGAVLDATFGLPLLHSLRMVFERPREVCIRRRQSGLCLPAPLVLARPKPRLGPSNSAFRVARGAALTPVVASTVFFTTLPKRGAPPTNCAARSISPIAFSAPELVGPWAMQITVPRSGIISFSVRPIATFHWDVPCPEQIRLVWEV